MPYTLEMIFRYLFMCSTLITFIFRMKMDKFPSLHCSQIPSTVSQKNHTELHTPSASPSCALGWSCHVPCGAIPAQAPIQPGRAAFPAHSRLRHKLSTFCLGQGTHEVIQPNFNNSQAWTSHGRGESGKTPGTLPFPSLFPCHHPENFLGTSGTSAAVMAQGESF